MLVEEALSRSVFHLRLMHHHPSLHSGFICFCQPDELDESYVLCPCIWNEFTIVAVFDGIYRKNAEVGVSPYIRFVVLHICNVLYCKHDSSIAVGWGIASDNRHGAVHTVELNCNESWDFDY